MFHYSMLLTKLIPLYMNIGLGYIAGKALDTSRETIARIMLYMINPIIIFNGVMNVYLDASALSLPLLTFLLSSMICVTFFHLAKNAWPDTSRNLLAFSSGSGNTGYFGLPLALLLFNDEGEGIYILAILGITLYENTTGYYYLAHGSMTTKECLRKLARLPAIYAFLSALVLNFSGVELPEVIVEFMGHIKGTYTVLGMMIIGLGLASLSHFKMDAKFIGLTFLAKFLIWPAVILILIALDTVLFGFYNHATHNALILMSIVPLAVNTVILATLMRSQPEKAATAVLLSTVFALVYVPLMVSWLIH